MSNLFERVQRERQLLADLQQKLAHYPADNTVFLQFSDASIPSTQELQDTEQHLINENKLLEVRVQFGHEHKKKIQIFCLEIKSEHSFFFHFKERINLINKRINLEKEKIYDLKLSIQLKTVPLPPSITASLTTGEGQSSVINLIKPTVPEKDLVMTKL